MSAAEVFWTVFVFGAVFVGAFVYLEWAWYWAALVSWLVTGVVASIMGVR